MTENLEYVQKGFRILQPALAQYVAREMKRAYGDRWRIEAMNAIGDQGRDFQRADDESDDAFVASLDVANCLNLIDRQWGQVFRRNLSRDRRSWVNELVDARNKLAHVGSDDWTKDDAERALDTMTRLCNVFDQERAEGIRALLRELRYGDAAGIAAIPDAPPTPPETEDAPNVPDAPIVDGVPLLSWRDVIKPHPDVCEGLYKQADFAVNLDDVARDEGPFQYRDPVEFFARTYVTEGMKGLLVQAAKRLGGQDGDPVLQLKTAFGGGKTHSLLALYHMARGRFDLDRTPNLKAALESAGIARVPQAKVAVVVGTALNPTTFKRPEWLQGSNVNTIWGEIAYQLARQADNLELYDIVKEADKRGVSPGSVALRKLFDACGSCLVLMDELVAYAKKLYGVDKLPAGSYDNFMTFVQEITEAASASRDSMVVATIPESEVEIGKEEGGRNAKVAIEKFFGRTESVWKPVAADEGFEIVRRRLFCNCEKPEERDRTCEAFSRMYRENRGDFPVEARELEYKNRMIACYPIHPEVFDRLYRDWATLEKFQRTRGVLRLMATVVHALWNDRDASAMIMPGSIPMRQARVKEELLRSLSEVWNPILDDEVDGKNSTPAKIDKENARFGRIWAARRAARTIMLGSAPTVRGQNVRGVDLATIRLGAIQPGENVSIFNDALNALRGSLSHLYADADGMRFWYDTRPTLLKTARERAELFLKSRDDVEDEIERRLKQTRGASPFASVHICPSLSSDVADEQAARLVVLKPSDAYARNAPDSAAERMAKEILNSRGSAPRKFKNMLAFVAPDGGLLFDLRQAVSEYLAWKSICDDSKVLNLDVQQTTEARGNLNRCDKAVELRLKEAYKWLLVPSEAELGTILWNARDISGDAEIAAKAAARMKEEEQIISEWSPVTLKMALDRWLWKDSDGLQIAKLWEYLTSYCYLPRLASFSVLESAIRAGLRSKEYFARASAVEDGRFEGLSLGKPVLRVEPSDYLVKVEPALKQLYEGGGNPSGDPGGRATPSTAATGGCSTVGTGGTSAPTSEPPAEKKTRCFLTVKLDRVDGIKQLGNCIDEVVDKLYESDDCDVEMTLEIVARSENGFPRETIRVVTENGKTLGFENCVFEE